MKVTVMEEGQMTIPREIREQLGIAVRTVLDVREEDGKIIAEKLPEDDPVAKVLGCLKLNMTTDEFMAEVRGHT